MSIHERFLAALDADDQRARAATPGPWEVGTFEGDKGPHTVEFRSVIGPVASTGLIRANTLHIAAHDPETTLDRNAALREIVVANREHVDSMPTREAVCECHGCVYFRILAAAWVTP